METKTEKITQKLWITVSQKTIKPFNTLKEAVAKFDNLATFVTTESQIICLTYNPEGNPNPTDEEDAIWSIEQVPLKEIAVEMLEKVKK